MIASPFEPVRRSGPRRVGIVIYPDAQGMDVSGPYEVFAMASNVLRRMARTDVYELYLIAETLEPIRMTSGARLCPDVRFDDCPGPLDTLIVPGSEQIERAQHDPAVLRLLRERGDDVRRLVSICTGAFFLAALGLLDGRRATTHWSFCQLLQRSFGEVEVVPDALYIKEGRIYTSAGITAGMDLALTLVEEDHGRQVAMAVARSMVLFYRRPGGQSQFSEIIESQASTHFGALIDWIMQNLHAELTVETLARQARMSPRNFTRLFTRELEQTPAKFIEKLRLEHARGLLDNRKLSLKEIAAHCGFRSEEQMRRAFQRELRVTPHEYRARFATA